MCSADSPAPVLTLDCASIPHGEALHIRSRWHAASARAKELQDSLTQERARADTAEGELRSARQQTSSLHSKVQQLQDASQAAREEAELRECALRDRVEQLRTRADALAGKLRSRLQQGRSDGSGGSGGGGGEGAWTVDEEELELLAEDEEREAQSVSPTRAATTPEAAKTRRGAWKQDRDRTPGHAASPGHGAEAAPTWSITAQGEGAGPSGGTSYTITVTDPSAAVLGGGSGARTLRLSAAERQREATLRRNYERQLSSTVRQVKLCEARVRGGGYRLPRSSDRGRPRPRPTPSPRRRRCNTTGSTSTLRPRFAPCESSARSMRRC